MRSIELIEGEAKLFNHYIQRSYLTTRDFQINIDFAPTHYDSGKDSITIHYHETILIAAGILPQTSIFNMWLCAKLKLVFCCLTSRSWCKS